MKKSIHLPPPNLASGYALTNDSLGLVGVRVWQDDERT